tara:strand:+ start:539 stop:958 length:420 start_codon:yes stop_codon:yes gene_type:complete
MININQLHQINEKRAKDRIASYEKILLKCHQKIKSISLRPKGNTFCFYVVPNLVFGVPIFNQNECIVYIVQALIKNGFYVVYTHPNLIYISWFQRQNSLEYKKKKNEDKMKPELNYKSIDSIDKQPKFIYDMANFDFKK